MKVSSVFYLCAILAFFLPFFVVSCQQTELISVKGIQLVTGGEAKLAMGDMLSTLAEKASEADPANSPVQKPEDQKIDPQPLAIAAFALAIIGLILVLVLPQNLYIIPALLSLAGIICLQVLSSGMMSNLSLKDTGLDPSMDISKFIAIKAKSGFWVANIAFFLGAVVAVFTGLKASTPTVYRTQAATQSHPEGYQRLRPVPPLKPMNAPEAEADETPTFPDSQEDDKPIETQDY
ncbi:hypothetical protein MASR1M36_09980 [Candidatus Cloacimonadaceae bacterium]